MYNISEFIKRKWKNMNKKEIRKEYKQEKKLARKEYKLEKKGLREEYEKKLDAFYQEKGVNPKDFPPRRIVLEEIGNAVTHGVGSIFSIVAFILMLTHANDTKEVISACLYFFGLFILFTMSCLYHAFPYGSKVKKVFRRFDYSSIYLLIGSTFAPILLSYLGGTYGIVFSIIQWTLIIAGISLVGVFGPGHLRFIHIPLYFILGWSALLFLPQMFKNDLGFFMWLLAGGLAYSFGIIPFAIDKKVSHFIWHFFVLIGAIVQWFGIYLYIYLV